MSTSEDTGKTAIEASQKDGTRTRKIMNISVLFLDSSVFTFDMPSKTLGRSLFDKVCKMLNLLESDYFGLEYEDDNNIKYWLDGLKPLCRQVGLTTTSPTFSFCIKFYTPDPVQLEDEFTRYLFSLQLKKDLSSGILQCNDNTAVVLISYIVQAEVGDYDADEFPDHTYLSRFKLVPFQDAILEKKILESHKKHVGQTPAEAELNLLETARRCELYGIKMTAAKDHEGVPLNLAVAHLGVLVFQNYTKINTFSWAKIRKLSFKRKKFLIKLHPDGYYKETVEFFFEGRNECKNFWKKCIENHTFFRCTDATKGMRQKTKLFSRGSSFRYSGRTQVQLSEYVRNNYVKRNFQRSTSLRTTPNSPSKVSDGHISPQPLLPVSASFSSDSAAVVPLTLPQSPSPPKMSISEPTTPHEALPTPDSEGDGGYQTPDYMGQDTDDNLSHDSYHVVDKEPPPPPSLDNGFVDEVAQGDIVDNIEIINNNCENIQLDVSGSGDGVPTTNGINKVNGIEVNGHSPIASTKNDDDEDDGDDNADSYLEESSGFYSDTGVRSMHSESFTSLSDSYGSNIKKTPCDNAYYCSKDLLMSERTYRRDLEIVDVVFREQYIQRPDIFNVAVDSMLGTVAPLYEMHCLLLRDLEQYMAFCEGRRVKVIETVFKGIGDILVSYEGLINAYEIYVSELGPLLESLNAVLKSDGKFSDFYREFESLSVCYLPLTSLLLRPLYRLHHYTTILESLMGHYGKLHSDYMDCQAVVQKFQSTFSKIEGKIPNLVNYTKLMELERNLLGFTIDDTNDNTVFLREGCLQKLSKTESHQCMLFLFSNMVLCCKQTTIGKLRFKVESLLPITNIKVGEIEPKPPAEFCFTVQHGAKCLFLATSSERERTKWIRDIVNAANELAGENLSSHAMRKDGVGIGDMPVSHHVNTSVHVCWHRNISIGNGDLYIGIKHSLSGFLLRKFKNNSGWQKLWVVLSNLCLFFFKSFLDESPLASLPLPGYRVTVPSTEDSITKESVFKLQYKNYKYFFRAESKFLFDRWMDVIHQSTLADDEKTHL